MSQEKRFWKRGEIDPHLPKDALALQHRARRAKPTATEISRLRDTFGSKWMDVETLRQVEQESGLRFRRGKFSEPERCIIRSALDEYLQMRGLSQQDFLDAFFLSKRASKQVYSDARFKDVFHHVAQRLDGRPVLLVYQCMRRMYHPGNLRGRWAAEEDAELKRLFQLHGPDWEAIGLSLGRYGMACRDRYRSFRNSGSSGPWTSDEVERLRRACEPYQKPNHSHGKKRFRQDDRPCWIVISEAVATRSPAQCMNKWTSLLLLPAGGARPQFTPQLEYTLVCQLYDLAIEHESEIRWRELAQEAWPDYFTATMLKDRFQTMRRRVRDERTIDMDSLLEALMLSLKPLSPDTISDDDM